jgi:Domain of unknown function (DUF1707)
VTNPAAAGERSTFRVVGTFTIMADASDPQLRASDEQREHAAQDIREHFAAGRLDADELDQRVQAVYSAKTQRELDTLLADLPRLPASPAQQKAELVQRRRQLQRRMIQEAGGGLGLFVVCTAIWLASGDQHGHGSFWPVWILVVVLIPLLRNGWRLYGPAPELDSVERELDARRRKNEVRNQIRGDARSRANRRSGRHGGQL